MSFKFESVQRFDDGCVWEKNQCDINQEWHRIPEDCDFYILRHWFLKCACAPDAIFFVEKEELEKYIRSSVKAGDAMEIWAIDGESMIYSHSKMPNKEGKVPVKGCAY